MKSVITLLRVKQREMDALKRQQAVIENQRQDVITRIDKLSAQLAHELKSAEAMPEMAHFFGDFSVTIKTRQEQLRKQLFRLDLERDKIAVQIFDRFSEMKKYDLALANWNKQRDQLANRRAQQYMDEIAIRGYIRRHET